MSDNTNMPHTPAERYTQLDSALQLAERTESPSEVHGLIVGCLSNHLATGVKPSLIDLFMGDEKQANTSSLIDLIYEVYRESSELLFDNNENFDLVTPDDDASVEARTDALAHWCQGYMLGLLHSDKVSIDQLPEDGPEIARDIMSISQAGPSEGEEAEKDEWALEELREYVKVGVQLIFEFIYQSRSPKDAPETKQ